MRRSNRVTLLCGLLSASPALAQSGSNSYTLTQGSAAYQPVFGTELAFTDPDDSMSQISLPFGFSFFGRAYAPGSTLYASTNGSLQFDGAVADVNNAAIPSSATPNGILAPFWDDLILNSGRVVWGTTGSSGNRILTLEWANVTRYMGTSENISFQVRLFEASGVIEFVYGPAALASASTGSIGLEDSTGAVGVGHSCTPSCTYANVPEGTRLTFTPSGGSGPPSPELAIVASPPLPPQLAPGRYQQQYTIENDGTVPAATEVALYAGMGPVVTTNDQRLGVATSATVDSGRTWIGMLDYEISLAAGTYQLALIVDPNQRVTESNENNNVYPLGTVLVGTAPNGTITVTTQNLPSGRVDSPYSAQLVQMGATNPSWRQVSGGVPGLSLAPNGRLTGTPTQDGSFDVRVEATQAGFAPGSADLVVTVTPAGGLGLVTTELPVATVGSTYDARLEAAGGSPPYGMTIIGGRPAWLMMNSTGQMSGSPTEAGRYTLRISLSDSAGTFVDAELDLEVVEGGVLRIETESSALPRGVIAINYTANLRAAGGVQPYSWSLAGGSLPDGLMLGTDGNITGVPTRAGPSNFEAQVSDSAGSSERRMFSIAIDDRPAAFRATVPAQISLTFGVDANFALTAEGGVQPYVWSIASGAPPDGIVLTGDRLMGRPTSSTAPASAVVFQVADAMGEVQQASTSIEIVRPAPPRPPINRSGGRDAAGCRCVAVPRDGASGALIGISLWLFVACAFLVRRSVVSRGPCPAPPTPRSPGEPRS